MTFRLLVTGSRDWQDARTVRQALIQAWVDASPAVVTVVHGACPTGADFFADQWAVNMLTRAPDGSVQVEPHPADWKAHGKAAGPRRNAEMVELGADLCLAFIRNQSRGATHCAELAEKAGIPVRRWTA